MDYIPKQGDIIWINFDPQAGHEQKGHRPGLVVSNYKFNKMSQLAKVCPITSNDNGYPLHYQLEHYKIKGFVMVEHEKSLDYKARQVEYVETVSKEDLIEVLSLLEACY